MPTYYSPEGNAEMWDEKPAGYMTVEEWQAVQPAPPPPTEEEMRQARMAAIKAELAALDAEYLPPRTLSDLVMGVPEALERKRLHEEAAAPLRAELELLGKLVEPEAAPCA